MNTLGRMPFQRARAYGQTRALGVSGDGNTVVGLSRYRFRESMQGPEAFLWTPRHGMQRLRSLLVASGVQEAREWTLQGAVGISADGRTMTGSGIGAGWLATLDFNAIKWQ